MKSFLCILLVFSGIAVFGSVPAKAAGEEKNVEVIRHMMAEIERHNFNILDEVLSEDFLIHFPEAPNITSEQQKNAIRNFYRAFPDHYHRFDDVITSGDKVVVRFTFGGTHTGAFAGIEPTGKKVEWGAVFIFRFKSGKLAEIWAIEDSLSLFDQLGMELKPKENKQ